VQSSPEQPTATLRALSLHRNHHASAARRTFFPSTRADTVRIARLTLQIACPRPSLRRLTPSPWVRLLPSPFAFKITTRPHCYPYRDLAVFKRCIGIINDVHKTPLYRVMNCHGRRPHRRLLLRLLRRHPSRYSSALLTLPPRQLPTVHRLQGRLHRPALPCLTAKLPRPMSSGAIQ
jgi:hypothetical protein